MPQPVASKRSPHSASERCERVEWGALPPGAAKAALRFVFATGYTVGIGTVVLKKDTKAGVAWGGGITVVAAILTLIASGNPAPRWAVGALGTLGFLCFLSIAKIHKWLGASADNFVLQFFGSALRTTVVAITIGAPIFGLCWFAWPPVRRHILDNNEKAKFSMPLSVQTSGRDKILLACPAAEESACVYAAQFINIFKGAGWKLQSYEIQRVNLAVPYEGIRMFGYVREYPPADAPPDVGEWAAISPSMVSIYKAFASIGIETETGIRKDEDQDVLTLYFGSERADESAGTQFSETIMKMEHEKQQWPILMQRYPTL
jgi:hypothetical protein